MRDLVPSDYIKNIRGITYTDSEKAFIKKYGENALYHWRGMTDEQKADYENMVKYYSDFATLFTENYEDLKLYAIMYRNVPLYNIGNDIYSVLYFLSKEDEIIGYKEKLILNKTSPKAQVALLYSENEALFPKFCIKHANVNFQPNKRGSKDWELSVNSIKNFRDGKIPHVFSVNDLTDEQCRNILVNKGKLPAEYEELYDKYIGDCLEVNLFKENLNEETFVSDCFMPLIIEGHQMTYLIIEFIKNKIQQTRKRESSVVDDEIKKLTQTYNDINQEREEIQKLYEEKKKKEEEAKRQPKRNSLMDYEISELRQLSYIYHDDKERVQRYDKSIQALEEIQQNLIENAEKRNREEMAPLEEKIKIRQEQLDQKQIRFMRDVVKTTTFRIIYCNQNEIEHSIGRDCELKYNTYWLKDPSRMREVESHIASAESIFYLLDYEADVLNDWVINERTNRETGKREFFSRPRVIMKKWCNAVEKFQDEENEKMQRKWREDVARKKEEEARKREEEERKRKEEEARTAKYRYNQINAHPRDTKLSFDKGSHIYTVGGRVMDSVTTIIKNSFPEFDKKKWVPITAKKKGMTEREVLDMWEKEGEESREKGTLLHEKIESYYQGKQVYYDDTFRLFENMAKQVRLSPYRTEWAVYDYDLGVAGTVDFVDYQNGQYALYDWKRSEKVIVNGLPAKTNQYGEKGNYPIGNLDNTPYWHYALQLSMYKYILEHNYGMEISRLRLGVFHPTYIKPYLLEMPYLEKEVNAIFSLRSEIIF